VKTKLLHDMYELNQSFERVIAGLKRIETTTFALPDAVREWRAQIVTIQVEANRDFLDKVDATLQNDEARVCTFLREYKERMGNREDVYVDEERYDARHFGKRRSKKRGGKQNSEGGKSKQESEKRSATTSERRERK
jgi:hypothetical protein